MLGNFLDMRLVLAFLILSLCSTALSSEVENEWTNLTPHKVFVEPVNPVRNPVTSRIVGGTEVTPNSIPYQVAIIINGDKFCSGALVSTTTVLTVAHCTLTASFVQVRLGAHNALVEEANQVRVTSTNIIHHYNYAGPTLANDVAVILLPAAVTVNDHIKTIGLPPILVDVYAGRTGLLTGWGSTSESSDAISPVLRGVNVTLMINNHCRNIYGTIIQVENVCTSGEDGSGACEGDGGSPLVVDDVLVGLMSFAPRQCEAGNPTVFTRISFFKEWLANNTSG